MKALNRRRYTAELLKGTKRGINRVVYSSAPHENAEVVYKPRNPTDPQPWVLAANPYGYRFSGRECHLLDWRFQTELRTGVHVDERQAVVTDAETGVIVYRSSSRYAAEAAATRFEVNPALALEPQVREAKDLQAGDVVFSDGDPYSAVVVASADLEGDEVWIAFGTKYAQVYMGTDTFVVGAQRTQDVTG